MISAAVTQQQQQQQQGQYGGVDAPPSSPQEPTTPGSTGGTSFYGKLQDEIQALRFRVDQQLSDMVAVSAHEMQALSQQLVVLQKQHQQQPPTVTASGGPETNILRSSPPSMHRQTGTPPLRTPSNVSNDVTEPTENLSRRRSDVTEPTDNLSRRVAQRRQQQWYSSGSENGSSSSASSSQQFRSYVSISRREVSLDSSGWLSETGRSEVEQPLGQIEEEDCAEGTDYSIEQYSSPSSPTRRPPQVYQAEGHMYHQRQENIPHGDDGIAGRGLASGYVSSSSASSNRCHVPSPGQYRMRGAIAPENFPSVRGQNQNVGTRQASEGQDGQSKSQMPHNNCQGNNDSFVASRTSRRLAAYDRYRAQQNAAGNSSQDEGGGRRPWRERKDYARVAASNYNPTGMDEEDSGILVQDEATIEIYPVSVERREDKPVETNSPTARDTEEDYEVDHLDTGVMSGEKNSGSSKVRIATLRTREVTPLIDVTQTGDTNKTFPAMKQNTTSPKQPISKDDASMATEMGVEIEKVHDGMKIHTIDNKNVPTPNFKNTDGIEHKNDPRLDPPSDNERQAHVRKPKPRRFFPEDEDKPSTHIHRSPNSREDRHNQLSLPVPNVISDLTPVFSSDNHSTGFVHAKDLGKKKNLVSIYSASVRPKYFDPVSERRRNTPTRTITELAGKGRRDAPASRVICSVHNSQEVPDAKGHLTIPPAASSRLSATVSPKRSTDSTIARPDAPTSLEFEASESVIMSDRTVDTKTPTNEPVAANHAEHHNANTTEKKPGETASEGTEFYQLQLTTQPVNSALTESLVLHPGLSGENASENGGDENADDGKDENTTELVLGSDSSMVRLELAQNRTVQDPYGDFGQYSGMLLSGRPHGHGNMLYKDGRKYAGEWKHGRWDGHGKTFFQNGDVYTGQYRKDKRHGIGRYEWKDGRTYDGDFVNDHREGKGTYCFPDGSTYSGTFKSGIRHGKGCYRFADSSVYNGEFQNGKYHGVGECVWADGRCYRGEWFEGQAHGFGVEMRSDGTVRHEGQWKNDRPIRTEKPAEDNVDDQCEVQLITAEKLKRITLERLADRASPKNGQVVSEDQKDEDLTDSETRSRDGLQDTEGWIEPELIVENFEFVPEVENEKVVEEVLNVPEEEQGRHAHAPIPIVQGTAAEPSITEGVNPPLILQGIVAEFGHCGVPHVATPPMSFTPPVSSPVSSPGSTVSPVREETPERAASDSVLEHRNKYDFSGENATWSQRIRSKRGKPTVRRTLIRD